MPSPFLFHPLAVHLALSLGLFSALAEILPPFMKRLSPRFRKRTLTLTLLFLSLALLTGFLSLSTIQERHISLPPTASIHEVAALSGGSLFLLLWFLGEKRSKKHPKALSPRQVIAGVGLFALLVAATLGGHLVYEDRLGTSYMLPHSSSRLPH
ncbi:MAG: DUF2231 domain-containing protein [Leptospirillia bacterium]